MEKQLFEPTKVTKRVVLSVLQQLYDATSIFVEIHKVALKILHSKVCLACPGGDTFNVALFSISPELATLVSDSCNNLHTLKELKSLPKAAIPEGYKFSHLVLPQDGSDSAFSSTIHLASTCSDGRVNSQIVKARNRVRGGSAPSYESYGNVLAFELLEYQGATRPSF